MTFILSGCTTVPSRANYYASLFDEILSENEEQLQKADYISIYINDDQLSTHELLHTKQLLEKQYDKQIYTYTKAEVHVSGPYGKEKLKDKGIFLYIRHIKQEADQTILMIEKHDTHRSYPSIIKEVTTRQQKSTNN